MKKNDFFLALILLILPTILDAQIINTVAGIGLPGDTGDGGLASVAKIYYPTLIAFGNNNNYYFSENSHRVREVNACGVITTIAGNGMSGFSGDGGIATNAKLNMPLGVCVDKFGNIYINDFQNSRIRKVDPIGIISTFAGNGISGFSGDGFPATDASINGVAHVACDTFGNVFISDHSNNRIRKVNSSGIISTYVGTGMSGFSGDGGLADTAKISLPNGIFCNISGDLFIVEGGSIGVRKVDHNTHIISTVAGSSMTGFAGDGGPATNAKFWSPLTVTVDRLGNLYVADKANERIRKIDTFGIISTVAGNGIASYGGDGLIATDASLYYPEGVACDDSGNLFIADFANHRIRRVIYYPIIPSITLSGVTSATIGSTVTISANVIGVGTSYNIYWMKNGSPLATTTIPSVTYTKSSGIDTITARIIGCIDSSTSTGHIVYDGSLDTRTNIVTHGIMIYPNPAHNTLGIIGRGNEEISITNMLGRVVAKTTLSRGTATISIAHLPPDIYAVMADGVYVQRLVKE